MLGRLLERAARLPRISCTANHNRAKLSQSWRSCRVVLPCMQVRGLEKHGDQKPRWEQLAGLAADVLDRLLERAARLPRNYILDQTKCAPSSLLDWVQEHARARGLWLLTL